MMQELVYPASVPDGLRGAVVAIGNFDGVHAGHRALLQVARELAGETGHVVALTFAPHPRTVVRPDQPHRDLMTRAQKAEALQHAGADALAVLPFDMAVAGWPPELFMQRVLVDWLAVKAVCVGENFRFGQRAAGTPATLAGCTDFVTRTVPLLRDADGAAYSSTRLRMAE